MSVREARKDRAGWLGPKASRPESGRSRRRPGRLRPLSSLIIPQHPPYLRGCESEERSGRLLKMKGLGSFSRSENDSHFHERFEECSREVA